MTEFGIGWLYSFSLACLIISCTLYWLGGELAKWLRRFVAASILCASNLLASIILGNFHFLFLLSLPLMILGFSLPYGAEELAAKVIRRSLYALGVCGAGLLYASVLGGFAWLILLIQGIGGVISVILGVKNPVHSPVEEALVCLFLTAPFTAYPYIR